MSQYIGRLRFDVAAFDQPFHHFFGHMRHVIPDNQHRCAFPLRTSKKTSLLTPRIKCKEPANSRQFTPIPEKTQVFLSLRPSGLLLIAPTKVSNFCRSELTVRAPFALR